MVATAFMRANTEDVHANRQAGLLEFRLLEPGSSTGAAVPADRAVRGLMLREMQRHVVRRLDGQGGGGEAEAPKARPHAPSLLDWTALRGGAPSLLGGRKARRKKETITQRRARTA